jgi:uncharacterized membrane protein YeaQ/YmgE (transglycosylase-associated protein family)
MDNSDAWGTLFASIVVAMIGGYAVSALWGMAFVPATAGCLFLLTLAQSIKS